MTTELTTTLLDGKPVATITSSRNLTQEEIDSYWRYELVQAVLLYIEHQGKAIFIVRGDSGKFRQVVVSKVHPGEYEFSCSGKGSWYSYKLSDLVLFLEQLWEKATQVICLEGEIQIDFRKPTANKED